MSDKQATSSGQKLDVYYETHLVGKITSVDGIDMQFSYTDRWRNDKAAFPISLSIPLHASPINNAATNNFFVNLLPEEQIRKRTQSKLTFNTQLATRHQQTEHV